ncbi:MAG: AtpZ/AtpI family protein [Saprospiraceae bacterium]|nr:AtpZ/AtpI family protein [Pyrinomonadaceae bacterium]
MIKNFLGDHDDAVRDPGNDQPFGTGSLGLFDSDPEAEAESAEKQPFVISTAEPETFAETTRRSGLAWSAGIAFFASVVFMLILGWGADLLLGSSPWGIVGGIVVGSLIGFVQLFRLSSQIFKN